MIDAQIDIVRFDETGGVKTVSDSLAAGFNRIGIQTGFVEYLPPRSTPFKNISKKLLSPLGSRTRAFAAEVLHHSPASITRAMVAKQPSIRIYTHPYLVRYLPPSPYDVNIAWYHDSWMTARENGHSLISKTAFAGFSFIVTLSERDAELAREDLPVPALYFPNPISIDSFAQVSSSRDKRFVMLTRHEAQKDIPLAIRAWSESGLEQMGWELVIFGRGSQRDQNVRLAKRLRSKNLRFVDWAENPLGELLTAHALLSTSRHEGFPATFLEAFAAGTPIVSVNSFPACSELVTQDVGIAINSRDPAEVGAALNKMARLNPLHYSCMSNAGRDKAELYSLDRVVSAWLPHIQYALKNARD